MTNQMNNTTHMTQKKEIQFEFENWTSMYIYEDCTCSNFIDALPFCLQDTSFWIRNQCQQWPGVTKNKNKEIKK